MKRTLATLFVLLLAAPAAFAQTGDIGPTIPGQPPCPPVTLDDHTLVVCDCEHGGDSICYCTPEEAERQRCAEVVSCLPDNGHSDAGVQGELKSLQWRFGVGATVNPEGVGPKMDLEARWGERWGVKLGLGFPRVQDVSCAGKALFCEALHGSPGTSHGYKTQPTKPLISFDTEQDWSVDATFSWTLPQRYK